MGSWQNTNVSFVNPYNFISLEKECQRQQQKDYFKQIENEELHTGWIDCTLLTKTPIFIPNVTNDSAFGEMNTYDFFSYEDIKGQDRKDKYDKPVIPGSEIRGVIRSAYEAITNSCLSTLDTTRVLYRRSVSPKKPGILWFEKGIWYLQEAERIMVKVKECSKDPADIFDLGEYEEGEEVYFIRNPIKFKKRIKDRDIVIGTIVKEISKTKLSGSTEWGYLHKGEDLRNKHHESIFKPKGVKTLIDGEYVERLKKVLELYRDKTINKTENHKGYPEYELNEVEDKPTLVYYSEGGKYLSPACITKEVFENTLEDILKNQGEFQPCEDSNLCKACLLFGTVNNQSSIGTRVRLTDADALPENLTNNSQYYAREVVLKELSSPKISTTEFYLEKQDDAKYWDYDKALDNNYEIIGNYYPKIKGRKFYWHSSKQEEDTELNNRNSKVRPVKDNINFSFKVYFNNVTNKELQQLIWTLNIGDNNNSNCHKIGRGKPIGFGSVKIKVNKVNLRTIVLLEDMIQYKIEERNINLLDIKQAFDNEENCIKEFITITDFINKPSNIHYPSGENREEKEEKTKRAGYQWFVGNRLISTKMSQPKFNEALPDILSKNKSLKELIKK